MSEQLAVIQNLDKSVVFAGGLDDILNKISEELKKDLPDISTKQGRKEIISRARKAASCKSVILDLGFELTEDSRKNIAAINADRNKAEQFLDNLRDEIRKPVTDWEKREEDRISDHETSLILLKCSVSSDMTVDALVKLKDGILEVYNRNWEEFQFRADAVYKENVDNINACTEQRKKRDVEALELEKLRKELAERQTIEAKQREEQAEKEREERRKKELEEVAEKARKAAEEKAKEDAIKLEAENNRKLAEEKARADKAAKDLENAKIKAENDKIAAEKKAKADAEAAVAAERKRVADKEAAEKQETERREADKKHRAGVQNESLKAIVKVVGDDETAKKILLAIIQNEIPNIRIEY